MDSPSPSRAARGLLALLLLGLAVLSGLVSLEVVYPRVTYPYRPDAVLSDIQTKRPVSWAQVAIDDATPDDGVLNLQLDVWADGSVEDGVEDEATLVVLVPTPVPGSVTCAGTQACTFDTFTAAFAETYRRQRVHAVVRWQPGSEAGTVQASVALKVRNYVPVACTEFTCRGTIPRVFVDPGTPVAKSTAVRSSIALPGLSDYRWDSAYLSGDRASPYLFFTAPLAEADELSYQTRFPFDGTNDSAKQDAEWRVFIAGALVGVAGGLLVAAAQEGLSWFAMRSSADVGRKRRRRR